MSGPLLRAARRFRAEKSGATAVEFAIVSMAFIMFVVGIAYISIMYFTRQSLDWAVQLAARQAEVNSAVTQSQIRDTINNYLATVNLPAANVDYAVATTNGVKTASIAASFNRSYTLPGVNTFNITFSSSVAVPQL